MQVALHSPAAQIGVPPEHWSFVVQPPVPGSQTPFTHEDPAAQVVPPAHVGRHCPSAQTSLAAHWLEYWHAFDDAVHDPATQT